MNMELETDSSDSEGDVTVEQSPLKPLSVTVNCSNASRGNLQRVVEKYDETKSLKTYCIHALIDPSGLVDPYCIEQVGLAVWSGAYLMMEFLVENKDLVENKHVIELGAGTGLVSLVCRDLGARRVVLTDCCQQVLANARNNIQHVSDTVEVMKLDWNDELPAIDILFDADALVATDPIYDNDLTENFMKTCLSLMIRSSNPRVCLYIALEKRMVFTIHQLKAHYPHYEYWRQLFKVWTQECPLEPSKGFYNHSSSDDVLKIEKPHQQGKTTARLSDVNLIQVDGYCMAGTQIDLDSIPCCVPQYQRSPHMEIWRLWLTSL